MGKKRCTAIVLAAGRGSRMGSGVAKQYMLLRGRPLIWYALHAVEESSVIDDCILVTGAEDISFVKEEIVARYGFHKVKAVVAGGKERYDSVYNALRVLADGETGQRDTRPDIKDGYIFIQDGARPFLTEEILKRCYEAVERDHACVAGMPVKDTIKIVDETGCAKQTPDRNFMWQVQTPQVFDAPLILSAYERLMQEKGRLLREGISITDDAMVVETFTDCKVRLVEGGYENMKVTTPEDMVVAEALLEKSDEG
ncbi:MAG: 2-C-methyl-D-erythritol 4-phosphate cytidylyltransferase [Lachnospiraceae bacterium]|nr:2-C-methyl-D-erythritol 4-phosphate cytidylyltransferase [Lachnospiraceae bacterium]